MKFGLLLSLVLAVPGVAEGKKYTAVQNGKEVVVHTNPAPLSFTAFFRHTESANTSMRNDGRS